MNTIGNHLLTVQYHDQYPDTNISQDNNTNISQAKTPTLRQMIFKTLYLIKNGEVREYKLNVVKTTLPEQTVDTMTVEAILTLEKTTTMTGGQRILIAIVALIVTLAVTGVTFFTAPIALGIYYYKTAPSEAEAEINRKEEELVDIYLKKHVVESLNDKLSAIVPFFESYDDRQKKLTELLTLRDEHKMNTRELNAVEGGGQQDGGLIVGLLCAIICLIACGVGSGSR